MGSRIVEFFGYDPMDQSAIAQDARKRHWCPFQGRVCTKKLSDGPSGVCTLRQIKDRTPVICCPDRLYADKHRILLDVAKEAFGPDAELIRPESQTQVAENKPSIAVFGKGWGHELRLPSRSRSGGYFVDWILANLDPSGELINFVAVEVQTIDTTGNYQKERKAYLDGVEFTKASTAGFNWENVNKRILPQVIYKGHVLRREAKCQKGLFFITPEPVFTRIIERLGGQLAEYVPQPGSLTFTHYNLGPEVEPGRFRTLIATGKKTTTVDQVAQAFVAPVGLPDQGVYEHAIKAGLKRIAAELRKSS